MLRQPDRDLEALLHQAAGFCEVTLLPGEIAEQVQAPRDPEAIAYAGLLYQHQDVKPVALARDEAGPFVHATEATVLDRSYPLTRLITLFLDRAPGRPVEPRLREFVRYLLGREAQEAVRRSGGGYLPVLAPFAERELEKLE